MGNLTDMITWKPVQDHPLHFYKPVNNQEYKLIFTGKQAPSKVPQYDYLRIDVTERTGSDPIVISISLLNNRYIANFEKLVEYILQQTKTCNEYNCADQIVAVLSNWTRFLKRSRTLSDEEVQGLIGEMLFLKRLMIPKYGEFEAVQSWTHPDMGKQDFIIESTWYEIKTVKIGSDSVKISSLEQLKSEKKGSLVLVSVKSSTIRSDGAYNLKKMHTELVDSLTDPAAKNLFIDKTLEDDIDNEAYESIVFEVESIEEYMVDEQFPKLTQDNVPSEVSAASYSLNIKMLEKYKVR